MAISRELRRKISSVYAANDKLRTSFGIFRGIRQFYDHPGFLAWSAVVFHYLAILDSKNILSNDFIAAESTAILLLRPSRLSDVTPKSLFR